MRPSAFLIPSEHSSDAGIYIRSFGYLKVFSRVFSIFRLKVAQRGDGRLNKKMEKKGIKGKKG
jgi:hypothetical protein